MLSLALPATLAISSADARVGGGFSFGLARVADLLARRRRPSTAPSAAQPFNRTITQPGSPGASSRAAADRAGGGFFNRPGLLGGLAAGFLGAGLFGMLFGGGLFGGPRRPVVDLRPDPADRPDRVRGAAGDVVVAAPQRSAPAYAGAGAGPAPGSSTLRTSAAASGFGLGSGSAPLEIQPADYEAFERLLGEIQTAWSNEDINKLHTLATPEMVSYFTAGPRSRTAPATPSTRFPTSSCCRATSRKPGAKARPTTPAWRCASRWSTRLSIAPAAASSTAASSRSKRPKSGPSCAARRQLGALGDPADQLISGSSMKRRRRGWSRGAFFISTSRVEDGISICARRVDDLRAAITSSKNQVEEQMPLSREDPCAACAVVASLQPCAAPARVGAIGRT